jgi:hypothetical protein
MGSTQSSQWLHELPRLMAMAWWIGLVMSLVIRACFRPGRSHLKWQPPGPVERQRLK